MRSIRILTLTMIVAFMQIFSVANAQKQFTIGVKAAANGSNYRDVTDMKLGADAGIFMRFGNGFFFQPEVNYCFKSSNFKDAVNELSENAKLNQHFISVPALLGYHFINRDNFKFRLSVGPRFDFKIADNLDNDVWNTNSMQWGGQIGVGIDFWRFALDFYYCMSADKLVNIPQNTTENKRLNMVSLSLGFKFIK